MLAFLGEMVTPWALALIKAERGCLTSIESPPSLQQGLQRSVSTHHAGNVLGSSIRGMAFQRREASLGILLMCFARCGFSHHPGCQVHCSSMTYLRIVAIHANRVAQNFLSTSPSISALGRALWQRESNEAVLAYPKVTRTMKSGALVTTQAVSQCSVVFAPKPQSKQ